MDWKLGASQCAVRNRMQRKRACGMPFNRGDLLPTPS